MSIDLTVSIIWNNKGLCAKKLTGFLTGLNRKTLENLRIGGMVLRGKWILKGRPLGYYLHSLACPLEQAKLLILIDLRAIFKLFKYPGRRATVNFLTSLKKTFSCSFNGFSFIIIGRMHITHGHLKTTVS